MSITAEKSNVWNVVGVPSVFIRFVDVAAQNAMVQKYANIKTTNTHA